MPPNEWRSGTVGDLVTLQRGMDLPDQQRRTGNVPIMGSFGVTGYHDVSSCKGPGVTVGRSGASAGVVSYVKTDFWPHNACLYVKDFHGNDQLFSYYFLKTLDLASLNSGSAQPSLNRNFVHPVPIVFPLPAEQRLISATLGALDDKIDLNRHMNETLEAMARALFQEWFVDFGPVRAKAEGRQPEGLSADMAALFPDALDEEGKPEGWLVEPLGAFIKLARDMLLPADFAGERFAHYSLPAYDLGAGPVIDEGRSILSGKYTLNDGCILLSKLNPEISRVWMPDPSDYRRICSTEFLVCYPLANMNGELLFCLFNNSNFRQRLEGMVTGTSKSHQRITPSSFLELPVTMPDSLVTTAFGSVAAPLLQRVITNRQQNRILVELRDLLLPKLMSGEIRVKDVERLIEQAA